MKKLFVFDIDGTLTTSQKQITQKTKEVLMSLASKGHYLALASGRTVNGLQAFAKELKFDEIGGYLLAFNGAKVVDCKTNEVVNQTLFPSAYIQDIYDYCQKNDVGIISYMDQTIVSGRRIDEYIELEQRLNFMELRVVEDFSSYLDHQPINKLLLTAPPEKAAVVEKELQMQFHKVLSIYRSEAFFIEVMPLHVDKASSLDCLIKILGLKQEDVVAFGDGYNDLTMIEYAGVGVAMANAKEEVKQVANIVTRSNDEEGISYAIKELLDL